MSIYTQDFSEGGGGPVEEPLNIIGTGAVKVTDDFIVMSKGANAIDMNETGTGILFRQKYYDATTPAFFDLARVAAVTEQDATSTAGTQDGYLSFQTALNGTVTEGMRLTSGKTLKLIGTSEYVYEAGSFQVVTSTASGLKLTQGISASNYGWLQAVNTGIATIPLIIQPIAQISGYVGFYTPTPSSPVDIQWTGTVTATTDILEITNSGNAASMSGTGTGILFNQFYYDGATPAVADAGRIAVITEGNWTSTASTQDSRLSLQTCLNGTVNEVMSLTSTKRVGINKTDPSYRLHVVDDAVGFVDAIVLEDVTDPGMGSLGFAVKTSISNIGLKAYGSSAPCCLQSAAALIGVGGTSLVIGASAGMPVYMYAADCYATPQITIATTGRIGLHTATPSSLLDLETTGTIKSTLDILEMTNKVNAADMDGTRVALTANLWYYDASTPAVWPNGAGRLGWGAEQDATSAGATQDSYCFIETSLDGTVAEKVRISSAGNVGIGQANPAWLLDLLQNGTTSYSLMAFDNADSTAEIRVGVGGSAVGNGSLQNNAFILNSGNSRLVLGTNDAAQVAITNVGGIIYSPTGIQTIAAATGITAAMLKRIILIQGNAGNIDITADPQVANGSHGQMITFIGQHDTNTVHFDTGTGLKLNGSMTLGLGDVLTLLYDSGLSLWVEVSRSNNT